MAFGPPWRAAFRIATSCSWRPTEDAGAVPISDGACCFAGVAGVDGEVESVRRNKANGTTFKIMKRIGYLGLIDCQTRNPTNEVRSLYHDWSWTLIKVVYRTNGSNSQVADNPVNHELTTG